MVILRLQLTTIGKIGWFFMVIIRWFLTMYVRLGNQWVLNLMVTKITCLMCCLGWEGKIQRVEGERNRS